MIFYFVMVNAWSLAYDVLNGTMDKEYPTTKVELKDTITEYTETDYINDGFTTDGYPYPQNFIADNDDNASHHFTNISLNMEEFPEELKEMSDLRNKYHEKEILKDVEEYVSRTYNGHYTGTKHEYRNVQTLDLMAARDLASDFCQANILKYGSRYGSKDGKNKKDLMKVIHYAMLLLHFDEHYGKPKFTSGNIDHTMP
tara:strand:+ start:323 stop:919 length:597 start_codon:yes stop_codon:yes gene_type:complete